MSCNYPPVEPANVRGRRAIASKFHPRHLRTLLGCSLLLAAFTLAAPDARPEARADEGMIRIVTRHLSPDPDPDAAADRGDTIWRYGHDKARFEPTPDPKAGVHRLTIVDEPDSWVIDLTAKTALHRIDPGPDFSVYVPLFGHTDSEDLNALEFGWEIEYLKDHDIRVSGSEQFSGKRCDRYDLSIFDYHISICVDPRSATPVRASCARGAERMVIEYLSYERGLKFDPSLFRLPQGIRISEAEK